MNETLAPLSLTIHQLRSGPSKRGGSGLEGHGMCQWQIKSNGPCNYNNRVAMSVITYADCAGESLRNL